jgi:hypothetical protein
LPEPPAIEDEIVTGHLGQRLIQGAAGRGRKNHVLERAPRGDRLNRPGGAGQPLEETIQRKRCQDIDYVT